VTKFKPSECAFHDVDRHLVASTERQAHNMCMYLASNLVPSDGAGLSANAIIRFRRLSANSRGQYGRLIFRRSFQKSTGTVKDEFTFFALMQDRWAYVHERVA
jgi:hypothetical protein